MDLLCPFPSSNDYLISFDAMLIRSQMSKVLLSYESFKSIGLDLLHEGLIPALFDLSERSLICILDFDKVTV